MRSHGVWPQLIVWQYSTYQEICTRRALFVFCCGLVLVGFNQILRGDLFRTIYPDSKFHVAHMGPTWVLSAPGGSHVGPMNLAIRVKQLYDCSSCRLTVGQRKKVTAVTFFRCPSVRFELATEQWYDCPGAGEVTISSWYQSTYNW